MIKFDIKTRNITILGNPPSKPSTHFRNSSTLSENMIKKEKLRDSPNHYLSILETNHSEREIYKSRNTKEHKSGYNPFSTQINVMLKSVAKTNYLTHTIDNFIKTKQTPSIRFIQNNMNKNSNYINKIKFSKLNNINKKNQIEKNVDFNPSMFDKHAINRRIKTKSLNFDFKDYLTRRTKSSVYAVKREKESCDNKYDQAKKENLKKENKLKMKWATIKWLMENKKDSIRKLVSYNRRILTSFNKMMKKSNAKGFSKQKFSELINNSGISDDPVFINKLFWIFDNDQSGEIDFKEIVSGIEMFFESSSKLKIKSFFELSDTDNSGSVSKSEFYNIMKKNIISSGERINLKRVIDKIFKSIGSSNGEVTLEELYRGCEKNEQIFEIIENNMNTLKTIEVEIDNDLKLDFLNYRAPTDQRMRKIFEIPEIYYPPKENKLEKLIDKLIESKNKISHYHDKYKTITHPFTCEDFFEENKSVDSETNF